MVLDPLPAGEFDEPEHGKRFVGHRLWSDASTALPRTGYCVAMSRDNVEVVRHAFEALAREDWVGLSELISDDCEVHDFDILDADVYRGPDGLLDWLAHWDRAWETWSPRELNFRETGNDRVLALFRMVATGRGSGIELDRRDAIAFTVRGGKLSRLEYYNDQQRALEAVGVRE